MATLPATADDRIMWDILFSLYRLPIVTAADKAGIFSTLSTQAMTTNALATELGVDARALKIHLGVLAAMELLECRDNCWRATAAAQTWLHPQAEGYYGPMLNGFRQSQPLYEQLLATLDTGDRAESHQSAADEWERGDMPPELARSITAFMNAHSCAAAKAVAHQSFLSEITSILDVGGGSGIFSIQMAKAWPNLRATIMEIDVVCKEADGYIDSANIHKQVSTQAVNMFTQDWPGQYDAHFFSNVFHDWSDNTCRMLARKSFEALPSGGKIILHEMLMDDDGCGPLVTACFSLLMLLGTKGRQFSFPELKSFLEDAGFVDVEAIKIGSAYYSVVIARKP